jgi:hypothetical protein
MKRLLRTALTWLLFVTVPVQGYAASAMLFCGAAHEPVGVSVVDHAAHGHAVHAHDGAHHETAATAAGGHETSSFDLTDLVHGACSVCASCCSGAALPAATIDPSVVQQQLTPSLPIENAAPDRAPARLERPPRTTLA